MPRKTKLLYRLEFTARALTLHPEARRTLRDLLRARVPRRRWLIYGVVYE
jgi:hypothetical protein